MMNYIYFYFAGETSYTTSIQQTIKFYPFQPFWTIVYDAMPGHPNNKRHPEFPTFTANGLKRNAHASPQEHPVLNGMSKKITSHPNEKEAFMKQLYYDLFN